MSISQSYMKRSKQNLPLTARNKKILQPTNTLIAIAGREMKSCPSFVICCTGVYIILQELSD